MYKVVEIRILYLLFLEVWPVSAVSEEIVDSVVFFIVKQSPEFHEWQFSGI